MLSLVNHVGYEGGKIAEKMDNPGWRVMLIFYAKLVTFIIHMNHQRKHLIVYVMTFF